MATIIVGEEPRSSDPTVSEWGNPTEFIFGSSTAKYPDLSGLIIVERVPPKLKHLSRVRKRKQSDSVSSGERNRNSPNRSDPSGLERGCRTPMWDPHLLVE